MIRLALFCTILTIVGFSRLPILRAKITVPIYAECLRIAPHARHESEIRSLVCGSSLQKSLRDPNDGSDAIAAWRNLGLIHILVVSGGHLSILAAILTAILGLLSTPTARLIGTKTLVFRQASRLIIGLLLTLFCLANQMQPPVLRALIEWSTRRQFERRGWRSPEIALFSTWVALPFSSSIYDLLSLALSFFASVVVEQTARSLFRHRWLAAFSLQIAVWWALLPLLFTMGVPHPFTSMLNVILAPLLGATLIPLAMLTWISGSLRPFSNGDDPVRLGGVFDFVWEKTSMAIVGMSQVLPEASPRLKGQRPLLFHTDAEFGGAELTIALLFACAAGIAALLIRTRRAQRRQSFSTTSSFASAKLWPTIFAISAFGLAILVHRNLCR